MTILALFEVKGLLLAIWLSMCDFLAFSKQNGHDGLRLFDWSFSLTFNANIDFCMEVLCIQLFGLCKSECINNGNFLQCREISHGADTIIRNDQEIRAEKPWTFLTLCKHSCWEQRREHLHIPCLIVLAGMASCSGIATTVHGHGVQTQETLCMAKFCVCAL